MTPVIDECGKALEMNVGRAVDTDGEIIELARYGLLSKYLSSIINKYTTIIIKYSNIINMIYTSHGVIGEDASTSVMIPVSIIEN